MKSRLLKLQLLLFALLLGSSAAHAELYYYYRTVAMFISAEDIKDITNPQEKAAAELFMNHQFEGGDTEKMLITPKTLYKLSYPQIDCLWIHIDYKGGNPVQGVGNLADPYCRADFLNAVRKFHEDGGNLYLSKFAVQLLFPDGIGRLPDNLRTNIFHPNNESYNEDIWSINAKIGAIGYNKDGHSQYYDRSIHAIYGKKDEDNRLVEMNHNQWPKNPDPIYNDNGYTVFPMQGNSNHGSIRREDHDCMWRLAGKTDYNAKVGIYVPFSGINGISFEDFEKRTDLFDLAHQEYSAIHFLLNPNGYLRQMRPNVTIKIITPGDIETIYNKENYDCIWIHIDRHGLGKGFDCLPDEYKKPELIEALKDYCSKGGNLLLTKQATQLLHKIGRIDEKFAPGIYEYGDDKGGVCTDVNDPYVVNAQIGWWQFNPDNGNQDHSQFYDHRSHAIYNNMDKSTTRFAWETFPLEGPEQGGSIYREDHNCLWDLNSYKYVAEGKNTVEKFQKETNSTVLGTWGHVQDYAVAGIIEFHPTASFPGRIIANGHNGYELHPRSGENAYKKNIERLTFNSLSYLCTYADYKFDNEGPNGVVRFEKAANATVLGTWAQDWNHQAAGIVEFHPKNVASYALSYDEPASLKDKNSDKAKPGSIIANGIGCVQLYHEDNNNDYQDNANKLTMNAVDYLTPWHSLNISGVEDVADEVPAGMVKAAAGRVEWAGYVRPVLLEVYGIDGRLLRSLTIEGEGSVDIDARGPVVINAGGTVSKAVI